MRIRGKLILAVSRVRLFMSRFAQLQCSIASFELSYARITEVHIATLPS